MKKRVTVNGNLKTKLSLYNPLHNKKEKLTNY